MKKAIQAIIPIWLSIMFLLSPIVYAEEGPPEVSDADAILEPINKIVDLAKLALSAIAILVFFGAGLAFMTAGSDFQAKQGAKAWMQNAVIGLVVIWVAPLIVTFLTAPTA